MPRLSSRLACAKATSRGFLNCPVTDKACGLLATVGRMTKRRFASYADVRAVGQDVAVTDWITITQEQVNQFAEATGDHQWIHVDPERAKKGPFGAPVAHGYLTLSLLAQFMQQTVTMAPRWA
jgi:acyl dehydratase